MTFQLETIMIRKLSFLTTVLCLSAALTSASPIKVAIVGAPADTSWNADVQAKLSATGFFSNVDIFDAASMTPTLAQLLAYRSVLVFNDTSFADSTALGNNLADYVDAGGGVVTAVFANASIPLGGRFSSADYYALEPAGQDESTELTLGTIHELGSPLLAGVTNFDGGTSSFRSTGTLNGAAIDVADWSNGSPLIARRTINGTARVDLNFYPPSSDARSDFWTSGSDGGLLMGNALLFTAGESVPEPATSALVGAGLLGVAAFFRKRKSS
jgi:hypothetical protein